MWENKPSHDQISVIVSKRVKFEVDRCRILAVYREYTSTDRQTETYIKVRKGKLNDTTRMVCVCAQIGPGKRTDAAAICLVSFDTCGYVCGLWWIQASPLMDLN